MTIEQWLWIYGRRITVRPCNFAQIALSARCERALTAWFFSPSRFSERGLGGEVYLGQGLRGRLAISHADCLNVVSPDESSSR